ncbi:MAG TPA: YceI family protein [Solirubrobacterales bacterium]|nr:YceI family protein [Solirubrobacterales bacterium]
MATAVQSFLGAYQADPIHSWFGFSVVFSGASRYRGRFTEVSATLSAEAGALSLAGVARVDSISIDQPAQFRELILGPEFFDADDHPELSFRSDAVRLAADGTAQVDGRLTIAGITEPVLAAGRWSDPDQSIGGVTRAGLELETVVDRRDFGLGWQMELPGGGDVLGWDVTLEVVLALAQTSADGGGEQG